VNFYSIHITYKCDRGPHNTPWRAAVCRPIIWLINLIMHDKRTQIMRFLIMWCSSSSYQTFTRGSKYFHHPFANICSLRPFLMTSGRFSHLHKTKESALHRGFGVYNGQQNAYIPFILAVCESYFSGQTFHC